MLLFVPRKVVVPTTNCVYAYSLSRRGQSAAVTVAASATENTNARDRIAIRWRRIAPSPELADSRVAGLVIFAVDIHVPRIEMAKAQRGSRGQQTRCDRMILIVV